MKNYGAIILSCAVLLILPIIAGAQDYTRIKGEIREKADKTPSALMDDPGKLAKYLTKDLSQDWLKAYSIYYWVATNLDYDLSMARKGGTFTEAKELIDYALENKKGVCQHYAELFNYLAKQSGLESLVITGYTRQNNNINDIPHAWNAIRINEQWYLFDPTWGSGYIRNGRVYDEYTEKWFMKMPSDMIRSHMPFDPLFQFLNSPLSHYDFYEGRKNGYSVKYEDVDQAIHTHLALEEEQQLLSAVERMKSSGIINDMILKEANNYIERINTKRHNQQVDVHNQAVQLFNEAVSLFNEYIAAKNKQFREEAYSDDHIAETFNTIYSKTMSARSLFSMVKPADREFNKYMEENLERLSELIARLEKEEDFLKAYFSTDERNRMRLFR